MSMKGHQHYRTRIVLRTSVRASMYMYVCMFVCKSECMHVCMDVYVLLCIHSKQTYVTHSCSYSVINCIDICSSEIPRQSANTTVCL